MCYRNSPWQDIRYVDKEIEEIGGKLRIIYNVARFLVSYAQLDGWKAERLEEDLKNLKLADRWVLTKLNEVMREVVEKAKDFEIHAASKALYDFLVEDLSHRYVVAVRRRVWIEEDAPEKRAAYATLYTVLTRSFPLMAVFTPYHAEYLYQAVAESLGGKRKESVMMEEVSWLPQSLLDERAKSIVEEAFRAVESILAYRAGRGMKRRMPMKRVALILPQELSEEERREVAEIVATMANVTAVDVGMERPEKFEAELDVEGGAKVYVVEESDEETFLLGYAKELVRRIQMLRKSAGLQYDDVIEVEVFTQSEELRRAMQRFREYIMSETRASKLEYGEAEGGKEFEVDEEKLRIKIRLAGGKASSREDPADPTQA